MFLANIQGKTFFVFANNPDEKSTIFLLIQGHPSLQSAYCALVQRCDGNDTSLRSIASAINTDGTKALNQTQNTTSGF